MRATNGNQAPSISVPSLTPAMPYMKLVTAAGIGILARASARNLKSPLSSVTMSVLMAICASTVGPAVMQRSAANTGAETGDNHTASKHVTFGE